MNELKLADLFKRKHVPGYQPLDLPSEKKSLDYSKYEPQLQNRSPWSGWGNIKSPDVVWTNPEDFKAVARKLFFECVASRSCIDIRSKKVNTAMEARAAANLIGRMTVQPDATRRALIEATIASLKDAGVWSKLDAFYCMAAHSDQAARLNWVKPQFDLVNANTTAVVFNADRGFTTNGSTNGLDTLFTPSLHAVKMSQNSGVMFLRHRTNTQNSYYDAGWAFNSNPTILLGTRNAADKMTYAMNSAAASTSVTAITDARKVIAVDRPASTTQLLYVDGVVVENAGVASTGLMSNGSMKLGLTLGNRWSARQFSFFGFGASLTEEEHEALRNAIENYMSAVGA